MGRAVCPDPGPSPGRRSLTSLEQREGQIDLLFTDVVMPRMGGLELAQRVRQRWPEIRVIASSGHTPSEDRASSVDEMLPKPFNMASLGQAVRELLDRE